MIAMHCFVATCHTALALAFATTRTDDASRSIQLLQSRGLVRYGVDSTFNLKLENEVVRRVRELQSLQKTLQAKARDLRAIETRSRQLHDKRNTLIRNRMPLNRDLGNARSVEENNRIVAMLNHLTDQINLIDAETALAAERIRKNQEEASRARNDFLKLTGELRMLVGKTDKAYEELKKDGEVLSALERMNAESSKTFKIAPSRGYVAAVRLLASFERSIDSDAVSLTEQNGIYFVETLLNEELGLRMVFDTGASLVALPASVADRLGMRPTDADANITVVIGDGSKVKAKIMRLKSLRVGKCKLDDVECVVMPATLPNAPALIGGSFLNQFTHKLDPAAGRLTLSRIVDEDNGKEIPAAKKNPTTKKSRNRKREAD